MISYHAFADALIHTINQLFQTLQPLLKWSGSPVVAPIGRRTFDVSEKKASLEGW